jgi:hypothetical protein
MPAAIATSANQASDLPEAIEPLLEPIVIDFSGGSFNSKATCLKFLIQDFSLLI